MENDLNTNIENAKKMLDAFQRIKKEILTEDDLVVIKDRTYIKRSGWKKIAMVFNISTKIIDIHRERVEDNYIVVVKAEAVMGDKVAQDVGACSTREFDKYSNLETTEHNIEATAVTRAIDRAISDVIGIGELSAEEIIPIEEQVEEPQTEKKEEKAETKKEDLITDKQIQGINSRTDSHPNLIEVVEDFLQQVSKKDIHELTKKEASDLIQKLDEEIKKGKKDWW